MKMFSVVIITYNHGEMIRECLDKMLVQKYEPTEIVVSDDSSDDDTLNVADIWASKHRGKFANITLVTSSKRQGIVPNISRGYNESHGSMVKLIAGDDFLGPLSLAKAAEVFANYEGPIFVGDTVNFTSENTSSTRTVESLSPSNKGFFRKSPETQFKLQCLGNQISAPAVFLRREFFDKVFRWTEENFNMIEDWPSWLYTSLNGIHIPHFSGPSVFYRIHNKSVSKYKSKEKSLIKNEILRLYYSDVLKVFDLLILPNIECLNAFQRKSVTTSYWMVRDFFQNELLGSYISRFTKFKYKMRDPLYWTGIPKRIIRKVMKSPNSIEVSTYLEDF